jgi:Histidinol-phosphate/aromatic aminotransferase and cobyric acid decarboxylase
MSYTLNQKVRNLEPYEPISGSYRIRLDANESFLELSPEMKADILARIASLHLNRYPDPSASAVRVKAGAFFGVKPELITVGNGSDELLTLITQVLMSKGEKLVYTSPDFSMYRCYGYLAENECVEFTKDDHFGIDVDSLIELIKKEGARTVIFSNPCNPTGVGLPREEVLRLIEGVPDCLVVVDEAYMEFWNESVLDCVEKYDNLMVLKTCSKALRMAGIRCGLAIANAALTRALQAAKSPYNVNSMTQAAAEAMFDYPEELKAASRAVIQSRDELYHAVTALAQKYPGRLSLLPTAANFVFIRFPEGQARRIFEGMKTDGVVVRCMGDSLRITCGTKAENDEVVRLLEGYLS